MQTVTLSTRYQLVIPRDLRHRLELEPGMRLTVLEKGGILYLVPERPVQDMRGKLPPGRDGLENGPDEEELTRWRVRRPHLSHQRGVRSRRGRGRVRDPRLGQIC